ncbi:MAG: Fis family transcriptional regulator [Ignavibacteriales bacterium CG_4_9_14_3_um_filter_30_11]|nr:MAG: Fis family transcriptional regulator [Ignavibacteriales bacterium CG_4_9_14_3_um_filter_30_11]
MIQNILIVDDEEIIKDSLSFILKKEGYEVEEASNGKEAYDKIVKKPFSLVITDLEMPFMKGTELIEKIIKLNVQTSIIVITAFGSLDTAITALRNGADDYILKPVDFDELIIKVNKLFEIKELLIENKILRKEIHRDFDFENIVGKSAPIKRIYEMIDTVAETDSSVLITGKSGTGKELVAKSLHFKSKRSKKPFLAINCGAISENLIESELFGHKKGAFTGAVSDKEGLIKAANGGTFFLDEISEMPLNLQVKMLRALQEKEITPVGTSITLKIDVRFIASTNRELKKEIADGRFREDLYYRLNVIEIDLPTLKDRTDDIPLLADHFLNKYRTEMNKRIKGFTDEAMRAIITYEWKGEVRELENVIERAVIFCKDDFISIKDLPDSFTFISDASDYSKLGSLEDSVRRYEKNFIIKALEANDNDKEKTAEQLKVGLSTIYRKLKELGINS